MDRLVALSTNEAHRACRHSPDYAIPCGNPIGVGGRSCGKIKSNIHLKSCADVHFVFCGLLYVCPVILMGEETENPLVVRLYEEKKGQHGKIAIEAISKGGFKNGKR